MYAKLFGSLVILAALAVSGLFGLGEVQQSASAANNPDQPRCCKLRWECCKSFQPCCRN